MSINGSLLNKILELNTNIIIRPAKDDDALPFTELMNKYTLRKKNTDYFYWQYVNTVNPTELFVAYDNDILAGFCGVKIQPSNNSLLCGFTIDLIIRQHYRNRALFFLLEQQVHKFAINNGAIAIASLPNHNGMLAHKNLEMWKNIGRVNELRLSQAFVTRENGQFARNHMEQLMYFAKDDAYRTWRYGRHPEYKYTYVKLKGREFAVTKIFIDPVSGERFGDIVDFECDLSNETILKELFLQAILQFKERGIENITVWALPHTPLYKVLKSIGFMEVSRERYFCIKVLDSRYKYLYDFTYWHLVEADSEIY